MRNSAFVCLLSFAFLPVARCGVVDSLLSGEIRKLDVHGQGQSWAVSSVQAGLGSPAYYIEAALNLLPLAAVGCCWLLLAAAGCC